MKYRLKYVFLFFFFSFILKGQVNLVPNPSFEDTLGNCQNLWLKNWTIFSTFSTPDYFNTCVNSVSSPPFINTVPHNFRGYQYPRTGNGYIGNGLYFINNPNDSVSIETECVTVKLKTPLSKGKCYYGEFFISLGDNSEIATNQVGMLFTKNPYYTTMGTFTNTTQPQIQWDTTQYFTDTLNWVKVSGKFISTDDEEYLTLGSFKDGLHLKKTFINSNFVSTIPSMPKNNFYVYFDDVALYEIPTPQLQSNAITICPNADTLVLGDTTRIQTRYQWFANGVAIDTTSFITVKPSQSTTYVLQSTNCTTTTQTIVVTYSNNCEPIIVVEPIIPNVFTPNNDSINDVWRINLGKGNTLTQLYIYNRWGNSIHSYSSNSSPPAGGRLGGASFWDGRTTSGEETPSGVYFYVLQYTDTNGDEHKKNGYVTLIK